MTVEEYNTDIQNKFGYCTSGYPHYYCNYMPYTRNQQQMTYGLNQASQTPKRMDPYLSSIYGTEQSLYDPPISDKSSLETSVYASSPNSYYMYEQEKADMQSTFGKISCGRNTCHSAMSEDFDLNSQFENSRDINLSMDKREASVPQSVNNNWSMESKNPNDVDFLNCDIFNMDEDVTGNPTLAQLNASESLLDDIANMVAPTINGNEDKSWINSCPNSDKKGENRVPVSKLSSSWNSGVSRGAPKAEVNNTTGPFQQGNLSGRRPSATVTSETENVASTVSVPRLHQLLTVQTNHSAMETEPSTSPVQRVPHKKTQTSPGKRKQNITNKDMDEKWEEIKHYIYEGDEEEEEEPQRKHTRLSTGSYKSVTTSNNDDDSESDRESHADSDSDFDDDSQGSWSYKNETDTTQRKSRQYFWQYNLQSKGPKGARVNFEQLDNDDPHVLKDFEDPVFDPVASKYVSGTTIRHGGKARRGDGTDVSPNPKKLYQIGQQINKLNKQIDSFIPLSEMPVSSRNKSKKEKNKLASRACRLKKKAQHEAYKIKLHGLDMEHKQLLQLTMDMKQKFTQVLQKTLPERIIMKQEGGENLEMSKYLEDRAAKEYTYKVAGDTTEFVNRVLCKVEDGDLTGGLDQT